VVFEAEHQPDERGHANKLYSWIIAPRTAARVEI